LAWRKSNVDYNTIPKSQEWLIVNYAINLVEGVLLNFYIFKGERLKDDYIILCNGNVEKSMDDYFLV
jgi:hypothetical protein